MESLSIDNSTATCYLEKNFPHPRYCSVKTFDTFNITLDSHGSVFQELLTAYEAILKRARVAGWSDSDNKANLS